MTTREPTRPARKATLLSLVVLGAAFVSCTDLVGLNDITFRDGPGGAGGAGGTVTEPGGGGTGGGGNGGGGGGGVVTTVHVEPVYPTNKNWNDYVGVDSGVSCDSAQDGRYDLCVHGGELRKVVLDGESSCAGLSITDELGAFAWTCRDDDGAGPATFFTEGLAPGMGLGHLLDVSGPRFRDNAVTVMRAGQTIAASEPAVWDWDNELLPLPDNASGPIAVLAATGTIYFGATSGTSNGYAIDADKVAVVMAPGATLTYAGDAALNCDTNGNTAAPAYRCQLVAGAQRFLWIEGRFEAGNPGNGTDAERNLLLSGVRFSRVHRFFASGSTASGIELYQHCQGNRFTSSAISGSGDSGIAFRFSGNHYNSFEDVLVEGTLDDGIEIPAGDYGNHNLLRDVRAVSCGDTAQAGISVSTDDNELRSISAHHNGVYGIRIGGRRNVLVGAIVSNNDRAGIQISGTAQPEDTTVVGVLSVGNGLDGIHVDHGRGTTLSHVSVINHCNSALRIDGGTNHVVARPTANQALMANTGDYGLLLGGAGGSGDGLFDQLAALHSATRNVRVTVPGSRFTTSLWVGDAADNCDAGGLSDAGIIEGTCTDSGADGSSSYTGQASDAVLSTAVSVAGSFVGPVSADDAVNGADDAGGQAAASIDDWAGFENGFRAWGVDGATFPDPQNGCSGCDGGECRIWDWRLRSTDTVLRNVHGAVTAGETCPPSVHGSVVVTDQQTTPNTFLANAVEMVGDGLGDEDGLCESDEACIFSPNLGAYQGEGDYRSASCAFEDGTVQRVTMYAYPLNGR